MAKSYLIFLDGYTASGKSTGMGMLQKKLGNDFNYINKYTTRKPRIEEMENFNFSESIFLDHQTFEKMHFHFVYKKEGEYYGFRKNEIEAMFGKEYVFIVANQFFRQQICKRYGDLFIIKKIFIQATMEVRLERIRSANLGKEQTDFRLRKLRANKIRNLSEFDFVVENNSTLQSFYAILSEIISKIRYND